VVHCNLFHSPFEGNETMTSLLQMVRKYWSPADSPAPDCGFSEIRTTATGDQSPAEFDHRAAERTVHYRTLVELRRLLQNFCNPARTTVLLVIDSERSVHLPTLLEREEGAGRLILTSSAGTLLGTLSAGDLALRGRGWGWQSIRFLRDLPQALAAARELAAADEELLILTPSWLPLDH
jgi:hypothetical protein